MEAIDFCAALGIKLLEVLPINETSGDNSPYNPISSFALEPSLLTVEPGIIPGLTQEAYEATIDRYSDIESDPNFIDYASVKNLKRELLFEGFKEFMRAEMPADSELAREFKKFQEKEAHWLEDYSLFRELMHINGDDPRFHLWGSKELLDAEGSWKWLEKQENKQELMHSMMFYKYVQWIADKQWTEVKAHADASNVKLMGDIPFGISRYSADVWAHPELFDTSWSIGAPPESHFAGDAFAEQWGQNWGGPMYRTRRTGL